MGPMASGAAVLHRLMHEDEIADRLAMAAGALLIPAGQSQAARLLEDFAAVRVVAIDAIHLAFQHRMTPGEAEFRVLILVAVEARPRVASGVVNEDPFAAAGLDVLAPGAVAGFAAADLLVTGGVFEES